MKKKAEDKVICIEDRVRDRIHLDRNIKMALIKNDALREQLNRIKELPETQMLIQQSKILQSILQRRLR